MAPALSCVIAAAGLSWKMLMLRPSLAVSTTVPVELIVALTPVADV